MLEAVARDHGLCCHIPLRESRKARELRRSPAQGGQIVWIALPHWQQDTPFADMRDPVNLAKLPATEREEWRKLWADVDAMLLRARGVN